MILKDHFSVSTFIEDLHISYFFLIHSGYESLNFDRSEGFTPTIESRLKLSVLDLGICSDPEIKACKTVSVSLKLQVISLQLQLSG